MKYFKLTFKILYLKDTEVQYNLILYTLNCDCNEISINQQKEIFQPTFSHSDIPYYKQNVSRMNFSVLQLK